MKKELNGGVAFPGIHSLEINASKDEIKMTGDSGMTLRDYFAAKAIMGMLASCTNGTTYSLESAARNAYEFADVMIKERERGTK